MAKKFRPTAAQKTVLEALALCLCAQNLDQNVPELKGYFDVFIKQNPDIQAIWDDFATTSRKTYKDLAERLKKEGLQ